MHRTLGPGDRGGRGNPAATERQKVRFGIWASLVAIIAGIAMAIAISRMDAGIYQYMQTISALVAPPFAAILWVGLLWKRTNGAGAIASRIGSLDSITLSRSQFIASPSDLKLPSAW